MEAASDAAEVLRSTAGNDNFQRLSRLLRSGGTSLLREVFDTRCPPSQLRATECSCNREAAQKSEFDQGTVGMSLSLSRGIWDVNRPRHHTACPIIEDNMQPYSSFSRMGHFTVKHRPLVSSGYSENKAFKKFSLWACESDDGDRKRRVSTSLARDW